MTAPVQPTSDADLAILQRWAIETDWCISCGKHMRVQVEHRCYFNAPVSMRGLLKRLEMAEERR